MPNNKLRNFVVLIITGLALTSFATDYTDWVAKGYRWSLVNGPYAFNTKEDAKNELARPTKKPVSERVRHAYYLRPGKVVLVVGTDDTTGISEIRIGGVAPNLWTATKNLSARPVKNAVGKIETPGMEGALPILTPAPSPRR